MEWILYCFFAHCIFTVLGGHTTTPEELIFMRSFYHDCAGDNWNQKWDKLELDVCEEKKLFPGVTCETFVSTNPLRPGTFWTVTGIELGMNNLNCKALNFDLPHLKTLDLSGAFLDNDIITSISDNSPMLSKLNLGGSFASLRKPHSMAMILDERICKLKKLRCLYLNDNNITRIPECFGGHSFPLLRELDLSSNEIKNVSGNFATLNVTKLFLRDNQFGNGDVAMRMNPIRTLKSLSFFFSSFPNLYELDLSTNRIFGTIPKSICSTNIEFIDLSNNHITGFQNCSLGAKLKHLSVANNNLTSLNAFHMFGNLQTLDLSDNNLQGESLFPVASNDILFQLNLSNNGCTMNISENIKSMRALKSLDISRNNFYGSADKLSLLGTLTYLDISLNKFSGSLRVLATLRDLVYFDGSSNKFSGDIPTLGGAASSHHGRHFIKTLLLSSNNFINSFPFSHYWKLSSLEVLDFSDAGDISGIFPNHLPLSRKLKLLNLEGLNNIEAHGVGDGVVFFSNKTVRVYMNSNNGRYLCSTVHFSFGVESNIILSPLSLNYLNCRCDGSIGTPPLCFPCPKNAVCKEGNGKCVPNFFLDQQSRICKACRNGMKCKKFGITSENLEAEAGWYHGNGKMPMVNYYECPITQACMGNNEYGNLQCKTGYGGVLCASCVSNVTYRSILNLKGRCIKCQSATFKGRDWSTLGIILCICTFIVLPFLFSALVIARDTYSYVDENKWIRRQSQSDCLSGFFTYPPFLILLGHLTVLSTLITSFRGVDIPPVSMEILSYLSAFLDGNFLVFSRSLACALNISPEHRHMYVCLLPIIIFFILCVVYTISVIVLWRIWVIGKNHFEEDKSDIFNLKDRIFPEEILAIARRRLTKFFFWVVYVTYSASVMSGVRPLVCESYIINADLTGTPYNTFLGTNCTHKDNAVYTDSVVYGLIGLVVQGIIIPICGVLYLLRQRHLLKSNSIRLSLGFLYEHWRGDWISILAELCEVWRRLLISLVMLYFGRKNRSLLILLAWFYVASILFVIFLRPYKQNRQDVFTTRILSFAVMSINFIVIFLGLGNDRDFQPALLDTFFVIPNIFLCIYTMIWYFYRRITGKFQKYFTRLFLLTF